MLLSLNWIKKYTDVDAADPKKLGELITLRTAEVEGTESEAEMFEHMYVAKVTSLEKHPDADKLQVAKLSLGKQERTLVCGGQNLSVGMLVAYADKGAKVRWHGEGDLVEIGYTKVRGVFSEGMICAGEEIGLSPDNIEGQKEVRIKDLSHLDVKEGTPLAEALNKNDIIFEIDNKSLTHRPDLWGHYGFARELSAINKTELRELDTKVEMPSSKSPLTIESRDKNACSYFGGCVITGIKVEESPSWLKNALEAVGVRPVNNIVDITNYVMLETGQPMHAYDRGFVEEDTLIARFALKGEKLETLDHKERELTTDDLVIANTKKILGLAGVMGGVDSEIKDETTEIILEAAHFDAVTVRKTSTFHGLRTDAVQRFEKSLDPLMAKEALLRACKLIKEICSDAQFEGGIEEFNSYKAPEITINLDPEYVTSVIGADIDGKEMIETLTRLGFEVEPNDIMQVKVPSWRATKDVAIEEDLIEEIARMYGYENIEGHLPPLPINPPREFFERSLKHKAREILAYGLNVTEAIRYSFYSEEDVRNCMLEEQKHLRVDNFLSEDQTHMRTTLVPNMLKAINLNLKYQEEVRLFEFGRTYLEDGYMPREEKHLCVMIGKPELKKKDSPLKDSFYDVKGVAEDLFNKLNADGVRLIKSQNAPAYAHPNICLDVNYRGEVIGHIFKLHPLTLKKYDIKANTSCMEINFSALARKGVSETQYKPIEKLPSLNFDISVVVDEKHEVADVEKTIKKHAGKLLKKVELFDLYMGSNLPEGKKSFAFRISLHTEERTLTDEDMSTVQTAIFEDLTKQGGEIRGM